ncbi:putative ERV/ALR sulfhydryl oxidase domain, sulfhydryl oxidase ALR/ERV [Septoria linicola]|nr:putative ERV/ALR sulfhydryl oxidase domain, sulfhydryl oxidase ALR/ERV [Septoria linicola]
MAPNPLESSPEQRLRADEADKAQTVPKGVVIGPDGKPCKTCTSGAAWKQMMRSTTKTSPTTTATVSQVPASDMIKPGCPPDVEELGRSTWTLLHTMTANYPERPSFTQQNDTKQFLGLFGKLYPCWVCADDFRAWMRDGNEPKVSNREEFGRWMCEAHNAVNVKLGKKSFDCNKWEERWRTGWKDGSCD